MRVDLGDSEPKTNTFYLSVSEKGVRERTSKDFIVTATRNNHDP